MLIEYPSLLLDDLELDLDRICPDNRDPNEELLGIRGPPCLGDDSPRLNSPAACRPMQSLHGAISSHPFLFDLRESVDGGCSIHQAVVPIALVRVCD